MKAALTANNLDELPKNQSALKHYFIINYRFTHNLDLKNISAPNVEELFGDIFYNNYEGEQVKVGEVELHFYNYSFVNYGYNLYDAFDRSMNTYNLGDTIIDYKTGELKPEVEDQIGLSANPNILVIHELMLYDKFRSKGYGKEILSGIETFFTGKCGYIALQSFPKQHDAAVTGTPQFTEFGLDGLTQNRSESQSRLNRFYTRCGFQKLKGEGNYFMKNIEPM